MDEAGSERWPEWEWNYAISKAAKDQIPPLYGGYIEYDTDVDEAVSAGSSQRYLRRKGELPVDGEDMGRGTYQRYMRTERREPESREEILASMEKLARAALSKSPCSVRICDGELEEWLSQGSPEAEPHISVALVAGSGGDWDYLAAGAQPDLVTDTAAMLLRDALNASRIVQQGKSPQFAVLVNLGRLFERLKVLAFQLATSKGLGGAIGRQVRILEARDRATEIQLQYNEQIQSGKSPSEAVRAVADHFGVGDRWVWKILRENRAE